MRIRALLVPPLILGLLWALAVWWPSQQAISSANEQLDRSESEQLSLVTDIDRLNQAASQQSDFASDIATIARSIPSEPAIEPFLKELASSADQAGVQVSLVSPGEILDAGTADANRPVPVGLSAIAITLNFEGSYDEVMAFTTDLNRLSRLVIIDRVSMVANEGETERIVVDMNLRIFSSGTSTEETEP